MRTSGRHALTLLLPLFSAVIAFACGDDSGGPDPSHGGTNSQAGRDGVSPGGEGGEAGAMPSGPFQLTKRTPEPNASNVWFYAPIQLTFSAPLAEDSVAGAIKITIGEVEQASQVELSDDGRSVNITLLR